MGFSSCFLRFLPLVPLAALVAEWATCFAFWMAAFLMSDPFILGCVWALARCSWLALGGLSVAGRCKQEE
jgi:hypothetical protein